MKRNVGFSYKIQFRKKSFKPKKININKGTRRTVEFQITRADNTEHVTLSGDETAYKTPPARVTLIIF